MSEDLVLPAMAAEDLPGALREMAEAFAGRMSGVTADDLFCRLRERELIGSTALGRGVAVPHCKIAGFRGPRILLARSPAGVPFEAADGLPVRFFFLIVSSEENPAENLQALAAVSRLLRRAPDLPERLDLAPASSGLRAVLRDVEEGE